MNYNQIPSKPLVASMEGGKIEPAEKIYFFEREDGSIIHVKAQEAWHLWNRRNQIVGKGRQQIKLIGVSNGKIFRDAVIESQKIFKEQGLEAAQAKMRQGVQDELAVARGHIEPPPNMDKQGDGARFLTI